MSPGASVIKGLFNTQELYQIKTILFLSLISTVTAICPKRAVLQSNNGSISISNADYQLNTYCQWLIEGSSGKYINIKVNSFHTECGFDFLYIYDGNSPSDPMLASLSGQVNSDIIVATSGKALIVFYSDLDSKPVGSGIELTYDITDCEQGCAPCSTGNCICGDKTTGNACKISTCSNPLDCNNQNGTCDDHTRGVKYCKCNSGYIGSDCSINLYTTGNSTGSWKSISQQNAQFIRKITGHSLVYNEADGFVYIYGGWDLNTPSNTLEILDLSTVLSNISSVSGVWPSAVYNHRSIVHNGCMFVSGGETTTGPSNQFYKYCFAQSSWTKLADIPVHIQSHTLTVANDYLYIIGGLNENDQFISDVYRFDATQSGVGSWQKVMIKHGKLEDVRRAGHSVIYYEKTNSLIMFGGLSVNVARFADLENTIYQLQLDTMVWSKIQYPISTAPPLLSYHTAELMGDYMVIYGGHVKNSACQDNRVYMFDLSCGVWLNLDLITGGSHINPSSRGRYGHSSSVINGNIMLIYGGYMGTLRNDIWSYKPSGHLVKNRNDTSMTDSCTLHSFSTCQTVYPHCFWCSGPPFSGCVSRSKLSQCNPQYVQINSDTCLGICRSLKDCHSCVSYQNVEIGRGETGSCRWFTRLRECHPATSTAPAISFAWWSGMSDESTTLLECQSVDNVEGGARVGVYYASATDDLVDQVIIIKNSQADYVIKNKQGINYALTKFRLHAPPSNSWFHIQIINQLAAMNITLRGSQEKFAQSNQKPSQQTYTNVPTSIPPDDVYNVTMYSSRATNDTHNFGAEFGFNWNVLGGPYTTASQGYLEPYSSYGAECSSRSTCLDCQLDVSCGWCPLTSTCDSRYDDLPANQCGGQNPIHYLITDPGQCNNCSDYISCSSCLQYDNCEWSSSTLKCQRRYSSEISVVRDNSTCPSDCHERTNCSSCLQENDQCVWCDNTAQCDELSAHYVMSEFGQCTSWKENHITQKSAEDLCSSCAVHATCADCLLDVNCGWCGNDLYPVIGGCTSAGYDSHLSICSSVLTDFMNVSAALLSANLSQLVINETNVDQFSNSATLNYQSCPDVDECYLQLDDCHENATCVNTNTSYECHCNQGFEGDGFDTCNVTCFHPCINGKCSGYPNYECICELGWTNLTCETNCGCNNHSTCVNGTGICDSCEENTMGSFCELCVPGSYGDATVYPGCLSCECNGHGVEDQDLCNMTTGICYCKEDYEGDNCEYCSSLTTGNPINGGYCYSFSLNRRVLLNQTASGTFTSTAKFTPVRFAQWIITPYLDLQAEADNTSSITVTLDSVRINCLQGNVYIYDGVQLELDERLGFASSYCGSEVLKSERTVTLHSGFATIMYFGNGTDNSEFTARYTINRCPHSCTKNRICSANQCVCADNMGGANCDVQLCRTDADCGNGTCFMQTGLCECYRGFIGPECIMFSAFTSYTLIDGRIENTGPLARVSQTVTDCGEHGILMFGGFSSVRGALNDLWKLNTDGTWTEITPNDVRTVPAGRYLHAAFCINSALYIHGGVNTAETLEDMWKFDFINNIWFVKSRTTQSMAGHTFTYIGDNKALTIGGFSSQTDWVNDTHTYDITSNQFYKNTQASGSAPSGLMMHTAVYHSASSTLYIHGGIRYYIDGFFPSNSTYFYQTIQHVFYLRPRQVDILSRYLHTAVQLGDNMIVIGGMKTQELVNPTVYMYSYACDNWHDVSALLPDTFYELSGHSSVIINSTVYTVYSTLNRMSVNVLTIPHDTCRIYTSKPNECLNQRGCNLCVESEICYNHRFSVPDECTVNSNGTTNITRNSKKCDRTVVTERECTHRNDCVDCLTAWPFHGQINQRCKWCSYCTLGKCIDVNASCDVENPCGRSQIEKRQAPECVELRCRSSTCGQCASEAQDDHKCIWTRNFKRTGELGRQVRDIPFDNYNCVTGLLLNLSRVTVWTSPPQACPVLCQQRTSCTSCLASDGGSGGPAACYWSQNLNQCLPPSLAPIMCGTGLCAPMYLSGNTTLCPQPCSRHTQCSQCLSQPECGWCHYELGHGACIEGAINGPNTGSCPQPNNGTVINLVPSEWSFQMCPAENECNNTHHTCDLEREDCADLLHGYDCICKPGYNLTNDECVPHCSQGCIEGTCVRPDVCDCEFSWVGNDCSTPCNCNLHSECLSSNTSACLQCRNDTRGSQCELCDKDYVGRSINGSACRSCFDVCNQHTAICMTNTSYQTILAAPQLELTFPDWIEDGPLSPASTRCYGCANNTKGTRCETCTPGYFKTEVDQLTDACVLCRCNGHSFSCNSHGICSDCANNTVSPACTNSYSGQRCYDIQCSQCRENYAGTPTNGNQCHRKLLPETPSCLTRDSVDGLASVSDDCDTQCTCENFYSGERIQPLPINQATFFMLSPKFLNVDIKLFINLFDNNSSVDLYISKHDDMLHTNWDAVTQSHKVDINPKYTLIRQSQASRKKRDSLFQIHQNLNRYKRNTVNLTVTEEMDDVAAWTSEDNYYEYTGNQSLFKLTGIHNKMTVTIPEQFHYLKEDKFYIIVIARTPHVNGMITFRQDQVKIELFVFFSVFFSCFFKLLCVCIIVWKIVSLYNQQQQRLQRQVELGQMASRPSASVLVQFSTHDEPTSEFPINPISCEFTDDGVAVISTVVFQLPGEAANRSQAVFGSSLMTMRVLHSTRRNAAERQRVDKTGNTQTTQA